MKALVKKELGFDNMEVLDVPKPVIAPKEVLLKIKSCGVCGSDIHLYKGHNSCNAPVTLGHEFCGEIVEVGSEVKSFKLGDIVVAEANRYACGVCEFCRTGRSQFCSSKRGFGYLSDGGFAEYLNVEERLLHLVPPTISAVEAGCIEPAAVITSAITQVGLHPEDVVLVSGVGPIGLIGIQVAKAYGASKIIATGITPDKKIKFELAKKFGADLVVDVLTEDLIEKVMEFTDGKGVDMAIECSGVESSVNACLELLKRDGRMSCTGLSPDGKMAFDYHLAVMKSLDINCQFGSTSQTWDRVISLVDRGAIDLKSVITHTASLEDWRSVFEIAGTPELVKAVITFD